MVQARVAPFPRIEGVVVHPSSSREVGVPVFEGTRIPIAVVLDNLADGLTPDEIVAEYPSLNLQQISLALRFASATIARAGKS